MKFHYAGKYSGEESSLPQREHPENYVPFREPDMKQLAVIANVGAVIVMLIFAVPFVIRGRNYMSYTAWIWGWILAMVSLVPHEFLHGLCFRGDVYMYNNLKQGMLFVVGTEDMTKRRFILMSLCPNIIFGFVPFAVFLLFPRFTILGLMGIFCIGMGFGDYINVFNAMRQMPSNARTYLSGMHSYWYIPE